MVPGDLTVLTCRAEKIKEETESEKGKRQKKILNQREFECNYLQVVLVGKEDITKKGDSGALLYHSQPDVLKR